MTSFEIMAVVITLTALLSYINYRYLRLPTTIGVMLIALVISLGLIGIERLGLHLETAAQGLVAHIRFDRTLMEGMLSFLLFAGALHVDVSALKEEKFAIVGLATVGVVLSTLIMGTGLFFVLHGFGTSMSYEYCLVFGALISPTDPVAVLGIMKKIKVPRTLEIKIAGESLFNDGFGVVVFILLLEAARQGGFGSLGHVALIFAREAIGGALVGMAAGWITYAMLKSVDNYQVEILLTLALVTGGYSLAAALHTSGPIAIVVAGLLVGNHGRQFAMSETTRQNLDLFWELIDEILNALLFVLIGLEVLLLKFTWTSFEVGLVSIGILLIARWVSVGVPIGVMRFWRRFSAGTVTILTWGGLRGGIPVALALSLPSGREREVLVAITYVIVVFSILVQGLTIQPLIKYLNPLRRTGTAQGSE